MAGTFTSLLLRRGVAKAAHRLPAMARCLPHAALLITVVCAGLRPFSLSRAFAPTTGAVFGAARAAAPSRRDLSEASSAALVKEPLPRRAGLAASTSVATSAHAAATLRRAAGDADSLEGKVVLVTGASRGIGQAIAQALAKAGATVIGTATSESGAEAISGWLGAGQGMKLDVTSTEDVEAVMKMVEEKYGSPDILVNNAGITKDGLMMRMKDEQWDSVIDTNLNSIYRMTKAASKGMMKKRWGRIISISSVVASMGNAGQANYAAAKAGMEGFTRAYAREVASRGITVNAVAPGFIATDMTEGLKEEWKAELLKMVPVGRLGTPAEIADAVRYLASPTSSYVTGVTLHVNGGMYMT